MKAKAESMRYIGAQCVLSEITELGRCLLSSAKTNTHEPHSHSGEFEFCYIADGYTDYWIEGRTHLAKGGQFLLLRPGEVHGGTYTSAHPDDVYWLRIILPETGSFAGMTEAETKLLKDRLWSIERRVFNASTDAAPLYDRLAASMLSDSEFRSVSVRIALHELLLLIVTDAFASSTEDACGNDIRAQHVQCARQWIEQHLTEDFTIDAVALECEISVSYLRKIFTEATGVSPAEYRSHLRVAAAKQQIKDEKQTITEIAIDLGYSSSQYFATVFKAHTGMSPHAYRTWSRNNPVPRPYVAKMERS